MTYTSLDNARIKDIKKLQTKKYRDEVGLFFVEGEHLVNEAIKRGYLTTLILSEGMKYDSDIETIYASDNVLRYLSELESFPPIMGICQKREKSDINGNVVILDDIQDPGNLGTIIRSAVAFNIDTIILSKNSVDPYNSKVVRASQGLIFNINIVINDLKDEILALKRRNYDIIGTKVTNGIRVHSLENRHAFAVIMGNEGSGMSVELESLCDSLVYIEMNGMCESLNVGVATSIILYELGK